MHTFSRRESQRTKLASDSNFGIYTQHPFDQIKYNTSLPHHFPSNLHGTRQRSHPRYAKQKPQAQHATHTNFFLPHFSLPSTAKLAERENHLRESWVKAMEARIVRDELEKCQKGEGVNHYENCRWLADKYITMLKENRVRFSLSCFVSLSRFLPLLPFIGEGI